MRSVLFTLLLTITSIYAVRISVQSTLMDEFNYSGLQSLIQFKTENEDSSRPAPNPSQIEVIPFIRDPYPVDKKHPIDLSDAGDLSDSEIDPEIKEMIKSKMKEEIIDVVKKTAKEHEISCESASAEETNIVCSLCNARKAYYLTTDNWFVIGLAHSYRHEFAKLLAYTTSIVPGSLWTVAFNEEEICVVSYYPIQADIDAVIHKVSGESLENYFPDNIPVQIPNPTTLYFTGFKYAPLGEQSKLTEFVAKFLVEGSVQLKKDVKVVFESGWIRACCYESKLTGLLYVGKELGVPYVVDTSVIKENYSAESKVGDKGLSIRKFGDHAFGGNTDQEGEETTKKGGKGGKSGNRGPDDAGAANESEEKSDGSNGNGKDNGSGNPDNSQGSSENNQNSGKSYVNGGANSGGKANNEESVHEGSDGNNISNTQDEEPVTTPGNNGKKPKGVKTVDDFIKETTLPTKIGNLQDFEFDDINTEIDGATGRISKITMHIKKIPSFALSPEFYVETADGYIELTPITDDEVLATLFINGRGIDLTKKLIFTVHIEKNSMGETTLLKQDGEWTLDDLHNLWRTIDPSFKGFLPDHFEKNKLVHYPIENTVIQMGSGPLPVYKIEGDILPPKADAGVFSIVLGNIAGRIASNAHIEVHNVDLSELVNKPYFVSEFISSKDMVITYVNSDLDSSSYPHYFDGIYDNDFIWTRSFDIKYSFDIHEKCKAPVFCFLLIQLDKGGYNFELHGNNMDKLILSTDKTFKMKDTIPTMKYHEISLFFEFDDKKKDSQAFQTYIEFKHDLEISSGQIYTLDSKITFHDFWARYEGVNGKSWTHALHRPFLDIHKFDMIGTIKIDEKVIQNLDSYGIFVWGTDCYNIVDNMPIVKKERCFSGMGQIIPNFNNFAKSYAWGTFEGVTPYKILSSIIDLPDGYILKKVSPYFLDLEFLEQVQVISVPSKNEDKPREEGAPGEEEKTSPGTHTILLQQCPHALALPAGVSFAGLAKFRGLVGNCHLNYVNEKWQLYGMLHLPSVNIANGNILLHEENIHTSNNIIFKLDEKTPFEKQVTYLTNITLVGVRGIADFNFGEQDSFAANFKTTAFDHIEVKGESTKHSKDLTKALFEIKGSVQDDYTKLSQKILKGLGDWIKYTKDIYDQVIEEKKVIKSTLCQKKPCQISDCPFIYTCVDEPRFDCLEYDQEEVPRGTDYDCNEEITICPDEIMACDKSAKNCLEEEEVCIADESGKCIETKTVCKSYSEACVRFEYVCTTEDETLCVDPPKFKNGKCKEHGWTCKKEQIPDPHCRKECEDNNAHIEEYNKTYEKVLANEKSLEEKYVNLNAFWEAFSKNPHFDLISLRFKFLTDTTYKTFDIPWIIEASSVGQDVEIKVLGISWIDPIKAYDTILDAVGKELGRRFGFHWCSLEEFEETLMENVGLPSHQTLLIQTSVKQ